MDPGTDGLSPQAITNWTANDFYPNDEPDQRYWVSDDEGSQIFYKLTYPNGFNVTDVQGNGEEWSVTPNAGDVILSVFKDKNSKGRLIRLKCGHSIC